MKTKVCIRFKSGFELPIICDDFKANIICGEISSYDIFGIEDNKPLYIRTEEVECIYQKMKEEQE